MTDFFVLKDGEPVPCTLMEWARFLETDERRIAQFISGSVRVSTVFLGFDPYRKNGGSSPPLIYETMVFGGLLDGEIDRYSMRLEAIRGHTEAVKRVREASVEIGESEVKE